MTKFVLPAIGCLLCAGCATVADGGRQTPTQWTERTLDEHQIETLTTFAGPAFAGISGRMVEIFVAIEEDVKARGRLCADGFFARQLFLYREDEVEIVVRVEPRLVPDPGNEVEESVDETGARRLNLPLVPGASGPDGGCYLTYRYDKAKGELALTTTRGMER